MPTKKAPRAGKSTAMADRAETFVERAAAENEFRRALRDRNRPTPDSTKPAVGRVIHRIKGAVDSLARERSSRAVLELDTAHTFAHLSAQIAGLQTAFTTLADGVIDELDAQREEHARWRRESDRWVGKMAHLESEIWKRCDVVDDALDEKNAVSRATFDKLRDEMGHAERAVTEARMALIDAERREAETAHAMASLRAKAEGADLRLQDQIDALDARLAATTAAAKEEKEKEKEKEKNASTSTVTERDVVELRDWTSKVTSAHDERLRRVEREARDAREALAETRGMFMSAAASMSARSGQRRGGGSRGVSGGGAGGGSVAPPSRGDGGGGDRRGMDVSAWSTGST